MRYLKHAVQLFQQQCEDNRACEEKLQQHDTLVQVLLQDLRKGNLECGVLDAQLQETREKTVSAF